LAKMQFEKGKNSELIYCAKILSAKWPQNFCAGLLQGVGQNAI